MEHIPQPLKELARELANLPGLGPKSALRLALTLLRWPKERATGLGRSIIDLREKLCICSRCAGLSETDPCALCADPTRGRDQLCLISEWDSLIAMEEAGFYKGQYLVLGGLLAPLEGVEPHNLELERLRARLREGEVREIILALGTTLDAEATSSYIKNLVEKEFPGIVVSRLAQGIPLGAEVKFIDRETLKQSLLYRQRL